MAEFIETQEVGKLWAEIPMADFMGPELYFNR